MQKNKPTRMCIACRSREPQKDLIRLQTVDKQIVTYTGRGRSFYLCYACAADIKRVRKVSKYLKIEHEAFLTTLKEFVEYGED